MAYLSFGCRVLLLVVFAVAVAGKLRDPAGFRRAVAELVPAVRRHAAVVARCVVGVEAGIVVLLGVPGTAVLGAWACLALLVAFTGAVAGAVRRGSAASCHCVGASAGPVGARQLARNVVLLMVAAGGVVPPAGEAVGFVLAALAGGVLGLLVLSFDAIVDLFRTERITS
jgi:hypothetical protein